MINPKDWLKFGQKLFPIFEYKLEPKIDSFDGFVCEECGEMTVMEYGRIKGDKKVCIDCSKK